MGGSELLSWLTYRFAVVSYHRFFAAVLCCAVFRVVVLSHDHICI